MKCIVCGEREATVFDRNEGCFAKKKKVCLECHSNRLKNDFLDIWNNQTAIGLSAIKNKKERKEIKK